MNTRSSIVLCILCLIPASLSADINTDLVAHWDLSDGEGTVAKDRVGGNHGTLMGDTAWTEGKIGGAVLLDGDGDYIDCGSADVYNLPDAVTLAAWVLPTTDITLPDWSGIIMRGGPNIDTYALYYNLANQQVGFKTTGTGSAWMAGAGAVLFDGEWHHTAAVYDGSVKTIYLDAESTVTLADSGSIESSDGRVLLGAGRDFDPPTHYLAGEIDDARIYGRGLTIEDLKELMTVQDVPPGAAASPIPENQADDVPLPVTLSWEPGAWAATHNVYLGTEFDDVNSANIENPLGVLVSEGQDGTAFAPDQLAFGQTYFWRIDEVNGAPDFAVFKGDVWKFDTEPVSYPIPMDAVTATASSTAAPQDPLRTVDGSGLNESGAHHTDTAGMWISLDSDATPWIQFDFTQVYKLDKVHVWNHNTQTEGILGFGIREALIEVSQDGETWTELATVELTQATGQVDYTGSDVALGGSMAQAVRITALSNYSLLGLPQKGLAEVRFYAVPVQAREPRPADGSTSNGVDVILDWRSGREAVEHEVLFSTDEQAVIDGSAVVATVSESSYDPGDLVLGTAYFWKINEINDLGTPPAYEGNLWTFQVPDHLMIDDFEMYQAKEGLRIWEYWLDGFENPGGNGAVVGDGDLAETSIVYEGSQSMPMAFNNTTAPLSEVTRYFDTPVDLTQGDAQSLKLQVRGDAPSLVIDGDTITIGASGADLWNTADEGRFVYKTLSGDGSITARVDSLANVQAWAKAGVMIRESTSAESADAYTVTSAASGLTFQYRLETYASAASDSSTRNDLWTNHNDRPVWVRVERAGDTFNGYISLDGENWEASVSNPQTIVMIQSVKIGLCVTSHDNTVSTVAVFSDITTTGSVTGNWDMVSWGGGDSGHPDNDAAPLYLRLADTGGKETTLEHPNPHATALQAWDEWTIPLSDLGPVNPAMLDSITIGVGTAGAQGKIYVDAIRTQSD